MDVLNADFAGAKICQFDKDLNKERVSDYLCMDAQY
jgi:hypothetical protein